MNKQLTSRKATKFPRITSEVVRGAKTCELHNNGSRFLTGDNSSVCVIWNNLIGANFTEGYKAYAKMMARDFKIADGTISFMADGIEMDSFTFKIPK